MSLKSVVLGDDREASIKHQVEELTKAVKLIVSVHKALNKNEVPLKHKHARQVIVGTHKEKSCALFWSCISRIQLEKNPVISWKFCHLLHKLIQDGHRKVLEESVRYKARIEALGNFWFHLENSDYGRPNSSYCKMLVSRLEFHNRNHSIPGNLRLSASQVQTLANVDVNQSFELSIEMLDQMDDLLALQADVLRKVDNVNWSSLVPQGQCMLSPLILIILDTSKFYDHLVKLIFKLHSKLPPDALLGHRSRFNSIFRQTKEFYETSTNLQYFKFLVSIPKLPTYPPNFLQASELESYQAPNAYLHGDNVSEADTPPDERSVVEESLVDVVETGSQNSSGHMDSKDAIIEALRRDVEDSRYHNERLVNEARARIEQYENRLMQAQQENDHYKQTLDEVKVQLNIYVPFSILRSEVDRLRELAIVRVDESRLLEAEQKAQNSELNYQKMKSAYTNLRQEHIEALTKLSETQKELLSCRTEKQNNEETISNLEKKVAELERESISIEGKMQDANSVVDSLQRRITLRDDEVQELKQVYCGSKSVTSLGEVYGQILKQSCEDLQNALSITYPNQLVLPALRFVIEITEKAINEVDNEQSDKLFRTLTFLGHYLADVLLNSAAAANNSLERLEEICLNLPVGSNDVTAEIIGAELEQEMRRMDEAIQKAVELIEEMQKKSRATDSGIRLKVNEGILDSCNQLMAAIVTLVAKSRALQEEIVAAGHDIANPNEFYKRNHQWTEGLLSAARAVGVAATVLVQKADDVVSYRGKLEYLIVASQEIAASTAQLFVSSRVKADRESQRLKELSSASCSVNTCTANIVATVKNAQITLNEQSDLDFSHYTLHDTKKEEMESQVRILELEDRLVRERTHLAQLRKQHYQLAQIVESDSGSADK
uniref:I/LWEQ domain-containing protein n=1 Tax=Wuchereria bancrofti TaxID=6293 RepID=A0A1I8ED39_WUCBA